MIKLKKILNEATKENIKSDLAKLYKTYQDLLKQMYGPDGTETRKAAEYISHVSKNIPRPNEMPKGAIPLVSPEWKKIDDENKQLMGKMGELGNQINSLYNQLTSMGEGELVKQMRDNQSKEIENYVKDLADRAENKAIEDSNINIDTLKDQQKKAIDSLEIEMQKKQDQYRLDYRTWLQGDTQTPPPLPPMIPLANN